MLINADQALALLTEYADEQPDTLAGCRYVNEDSLDPVCIVGHILVERCSVPADLFVTVKQKTLDPETPDYAAENNLNGCSLSQPVIRKALEPFVEFSTDALGVFREAQSMQDNGHSWAEAANAAKRYLNWRTQS